MKASKAAVDVTETETTSGDANAVGSDKSHDDPTRGWALAIRNQSADYGDFITGLWHFGASTSDVLGTGPEPAIGRARDVVSGIPILWWRLDSEATHWQGAGIMDGLGLMQSIAVSAIELEDSAFPMTPVRSEMIGFHVSQGSVELKSHEVNLGMFAGNKFPIEPRLGWFLALSQTLSVVIETPSRTYVSTITADGRPPRVVVHDGTVRMKTLDAVVQRSDKWTPVGIGNISLLAGSAGAPDHHRRTYAATANLVDIPDKLAKRKTCLACGALGDSREHCVPNWIAREQGVPPVVAPLFCVACNNHFGVTLEIPVSTAYKAGTLSALLPTATFHQWALKTSLLLSAASDVNIDDSWMRELRDGQTPLGFQVFAATAAEMDPGYIFSVTQLSRSVRESGQFLFSFSIPGLILVVLRHPDLIEIPGVTRVLPAQEDRLQSGQLDAVALHDFVLERMTGYGIDSKETSLQPTV